MSELDLSATTDAAVWASEFSKVAQQLGYSPMDDGWLIGWFANAMFAQEMAIRRAKEPQLQWKQYPQEVPPEDAIGEDFVVRWCFGKADASKSIFFNIVTYDPSKWCRHANEYNTPYQWIGPFDIGEKSMCGKPLGPLPGEGGE